jgi:hypothetical protein
MGVSVQKEMVEESGLESSGEQEQVEYLYRCNHAPEA